MADDVAKDEAILFDIPRQRADRALTRFAEQADLNLIFPFEEVREKTANRLVGPYPKEEAVEVLLAGTGLQPKFSDEAILIEAILNRGYTSRGYTNNYSVYQAEPGGGKMNVNKNAGLAAFLAAIFSISANAPAAAQDQTEVLENIVVTGTRVARSGYSQPTPVTVIGLEQIEADAPHNLADLVNQLPSVVGSTRPNNSNLSFSSGGAGINGIDLRSLGRTRTLVLVDGRRSPGAATDGVVDINTIPQALIERIEVVTGGASAAYGSDALSGVINFILDKDYEGVKAEVSGGMTTYGDDETYKVSLTAGTGFSDGRGHLIFSGELNSKAGILGVPRDWNNKGRFTIRNPNLTSTNGEQDFLLLPEIAYSDAAPGGIITDTALRGTAFGPGGTPFQLNYGDIVRSPAMRGGDWRFTLDNDRVTLDPVHDRHSYFGRVSYEFTDSFEGYAEYSLADSRNRAWCCGQFNVGNIALTSDNAFIPPSVAAQMTAMGITDFTLGTMNGDLPPVYSDYSRRTHRYSFGAMGSFEAFSRQWSWDGYAQRGVTKTTENGFSTSREHFGLALDAVRDPASGAVVCRSTLDGTDTTGGCVPYNPMGIGVNDQRVLDYLFVDEVGEYRLQEFTQDVFAVTVAGEPFSNWAGEVSLALGLEHRREEVEGESDPRSQIGGWFAGNYKPTFGKYDVTEAFVETVIPIMEDTIDLNAAIRFTDYSTSGNVETWKIGATWQPIEDLKFRITSSRDIRAPNMSELFEAGSSQTNSVNDPFNNNDPIAFRGELGGNPNLVPEEADTLGVGLVLTPRFIPGLQVSADYFKIEVDGAIGSVGVQNIVDRCFEGQQTFCDAITRGPGPTGTNVIILVQRTPFNFQKIENEGIDFEATYGFEALGGGLVLQALATHYMTAFVDNLINPPSNTVGENDGSEPPDWLYRVSATYSRDRFTTTLTARGVSDGVYDNDYIVCAPGTCPPSNSVNRTVNKNDIDGAVYFDLSAAYNIPFGNDSNLELFATIRNIANTDPEIVHQGTGTVSLLLVNANQRLYDTLGTVFRFGARVDF